MRPAERRVRFLMLGCAVAGMLLISRLGFVQIAHGEEWSAERERNLTDYQWEEAGRGAILDRAGRVLAEDHSQFTLSLNYRRLRRGHPVGLMIGLDRYLSALQGESLGWGEGICITPEGKPLSWRTFRSNMASALGRLLDSKVESLRKDGPLPSELRGTLRFYVFSLMRHCLDPDGKFYRGHTRFGLRFDAHSANAQTRLVDVLIDMGFVEPGDGAKRRLYDRAYDAMQAAWQSLERLSQLLGSELALPGKPGSVGALPAFLDALYAVDKQLAKRGLAKAARREADEHNKSLRWIRELLGVYEEKSPRTEFSLEERMSELFAAQDRPVRLKAPVDFETTVALVVGSDRKYPGFSIGETLYRSYPNTGPSGGPYRLLGRVGIRQLKKDHGPREEPGDDEELERASWRSLHLSDAAFRRLTRQIHRRESLESKERRGGLQGVERSLDARLRGSAGLRDLRRDRRGRELGSKQFRKAVAGHDATLSIDARLQDLALEALRSEYLATPPGYPEALQRSAGLAVIDARSGEILALASLPDHYNLELVAADGTKRTKRFPLYRNFAYRYRYTGIPGSVWKPIFAVEALTRWPELSGKIRSCSSLGHRFRTREGWKTLRCTSHPDGLAGLQIETALTYSCTTFFAQLGELLGNDGIARAARRFDLSRLKKGHDASPLGLFIDNAYEYHEGLVAQRAVGYGIWTTPLLMARAYAGIATGVLPPLRFVLRIGEEQIQAPPGKAIGIAPEALARVHEGMRGVTHRGTARGVFSGLPFEVAGKTGTPEVVLSKRLGEFRNNAWFCGFAPYGRPTLAFAVAYHLVPDRIFRGKRAARAIRRFLEGVDREPALRRRYLGLR